MDCRVQIDYEDNVTKRILEKVRSLRTDEISPELKTAYDELIQFITELPTEIEVNSKVEVNNFYKHVPGLIGKRGTVTLVCQQKYPITVKFDDGDFHIFERYELNLV